MAKITEVFDIGNRENMTPERLLELLETMYTDLAIAINKKPDVYLRDTDGQATDSFLSDGDLNINTTTKKVEILTSHVDPSTVTWKTL